MMSSKPALMESIDSLRYWTPLVSSVSMLPLGSMVTTDFASSEDQPLSLRVFWMPFLSVISLRRAVADELDDVRVERLDLDEYLVVPVRGAAT